PGKVSVITRISDPPARLKVSRTASSQWVKPRLWAMFTTNSTKSGSEPCTVADSTLSRPAQAREAIFLDMVASVVVESGSANRFAPRLESAHAVGGRNIITPCLGAGHALPAGRAGRHRA